MAAAACREFQMDSDSDSLAESDSDRDSISADGDHDLTVVFVSNTASDEKLVEIQIVGAMDEILRDPDSGGTVGGDARSDVAFRRRF
jgi:hypothetical protein